MFRKTILKVKKQFLKSHQSNFKIILVSATTFSLHANSQLQCDYDIVGLILCSFNYLARDKSFMCYKNVCHFRILKLFVLVIMTARMGLTLPKLFTEVISGASVNPLFTCQVTQTEFIKSRKKVSIIIRKN